MSDKFADTELSPQQISYIAEALPKFISDEAKSSFFVIMRRWSVRFITYKNMGITNRRRFRKELNEISRQADILYNLIKKLPPDAISYLKPPQSIAEVRKELALIRSSPGHALLHYSLPITTHLKNLAELANSPSKKGRPANIYLNASIFDLVVIYNQATGLKPTRRNSDAKNDDFGPFGEFVSRALAPIWPNAGPCTALIRRAVEEWSKMPPDEPDLNH